MSQQQGVPSSAAPVQGNVMNMAPGQPQAGTSMPMTQPTQQPAHPHQSQLHTPQPAVQYNHAGTTSAATPGVANPAATSTPSTTSSSKPARPSNPYTHNISRTAPATVVWLHENFEACEDVSLGREPLYKHYIDHCKEMGQDPVNQASFGKLIRSVFPNLKTRRLGTRGNSKYHYYGIRVKETSRLYFDKTQIGGAHHRFRAKSTQKPKKKVAPTHTNDKDRPPHADELSKYCNTQVELPAFPSMVSQGFSAKEDFSKPYHANCKEVLRAVASGEFDRVQQIWNQFWGSIAAHFKTVLGTEAGLQTVLRCDDIFHNTLKKMLVGNVLQPIPEHLVKQIRFFGKRLEPWIKTALEGLPASLVQAKATKVRNLAHLLRRYTSLNHLCCASKAVLDDHRSVQVMVRDLRCISFDSIKMQVSMLGRCRRLNPQHVLDAFERQLTNKVSMDVWAAWLQQLVWEDIKGVSDPIAHARSFVRVWTAYSSALMRDLTLRSAESFGSYHLCRLVFDEILIFLIERAEELGLWCLDPQHLKAALHPGLDFDRLFGSNGSGVSTTQQYAAQMAPQPHHHQQQQQQQQQQHMQAYYSVQPPTSAATQQLQHPQQQQQAFQPSSSQPPPSSTVGTSLAAVPPPTTMPPPATPPHANAAARMMPGTPLSPNFMQTTPGRGMGVSGGMDTAFGASLAFGTPPQGLELTPPSLYMGAATSNDYVLQGRSPVLFDPDRLGDSPFKTSLSPPRPPDV
ncbi:hypothetical protein PTSG_10225 [Salpingoeca rosetta]|uniref:RFX-type winged-helix domain-containing protein n=1 Tax=Salpingoeca rosetta (strain ATCC 50818 / BSB-021) TaxID=946362 RepID=F2UQN8_SALR5|nr:uncharacterized protein PTSG_10225 [Salpingoeca rosetta]EGD79943.1 hypothetical protein PTSG_10225 [Salpingoeca rosetta]|eukprot:XP_004988564.1 hypothetical protein PTSG_10225 [Salpingoeca rosetta]